MTPKPLDQHLDPAPFDLDGFNALPRPDIDAALREGAPDALSRVFPYLFRPSRALAWAGDTAGFPLKDRNLRWLFHLPTADAWNESLLAVVGTDGVLSLWRYGLVKHGDPAAE